MKIVLETACGCTRTLCDSEAILEPIPRRILMLLRITVSITQSLVSDGVFAPIREFRFDRREGETWFYKELFLRP